MNARETVAWNLRSLRTGRGLSQEALADATEVNRTYVSDIERAEVAVTVDILEKLCRTLGVDLAALVTPPPEGSPRPPTMTSGRKRRG